MKLERKLRSVVLPVPVPPETRMLRSSMTQAAEELGGGAREGAALDQVVDGELARAGTCGS